MTASAVPNSNETFEEFARRLSAQSKTERREIWADFGSYSFNVRPSFSQTEIVDRYYDWLRAHKVSL